MRIKQLAPPPPIDPVRAAERVNRAMFFVGAVFCFVGLRFFLAPAQLAQTAVGRTLTGPFDDAWSGLYVIGGLLLMIGIAGKAPRVELPGVTLLATATAINGGALVLIGGSRGIAQLPLFLLVLWVFEGRIRDLHDLPRERRHGEPDRRSIGERVERRLQISVAPIALLASADIGTSILIALLGGGIVTALAQAVLVRPQRRALEATLSKTAVESADIALRQARAEVRETRQEARDLRDELHALRGRLEAAEHRCDVLERVLIERGLPLPE